jgi:hypothetical protein
VFYRAFIADAALMRTACLVALGLILHGDPASLSIAG